MKKQRKVLNIIRRIKTVEGNKSLGFSRLEFLLFFFKIKNKSENMFT